MTQKSDDLCLFKFGWDASNPPKVAAEILVISI